MGMPALDWVLSTLRKEVVATIQVVSDEGHVGFTNSLLTVQT